MREYSFIRDNKQRLKHLSQMLDDVPNYPCDNTPIVSYPYDVIPIVPYPYDIDIYLDCEHTPSVDY